MQQLRVSSAAKPKTSERRASTKSKRRRNSKEKRRRDERPRNLANVRVLLEDRHRKSVRQLLLVSFIALIAGVLAIAFGFTMKPNHKGFFCSDKDISYPYKRKESLPSWVTLMFSAIVSLFSQTVVDIVNWKQFKTTSLYRKCDESVQKHVFTMTVMIGLKSMFLGFLSIAISIMVTVLIAKSFGEFSPDYVSLCYRTLEDRVEACKNHQTDKDDVYWPVYVDDIMDCTREKAKKELISSRDSFPSITRTSLFATIFFHLIYSTMQVKPLTARYLFLIWQGCMVAMTSVLGFAELGDNKHALKDVGAALLVSGVIAPLIYCFLHFTKKKECADLERTISA